jgi:hypothetical protein
MDNYCTPQMPCIYSTWTFISGNTLNVSRSPNGVPGSYGWCLQIDDAKELKVEGMNCTTDGAESVFVDTYPCVGCTISTSSFNADFGGQGISGPAALFENSSGTEGPSNSIKAITLTGITTSTFQSEWEPLCSNCLLQ